MYSGQHFEACTETYIRVEAEQAMEEISSEQALSPKTSAHMFLSVKIQKNSMDCQTGAKGGRFRARRVIRSEQSNV